MSRKNTRPDVKTSDSCIYCGDVVPPPTNVTSTQKPPKFQINSNNGAKKPRNRKRKTAVDGKPKPYPIRRRRGPKRKPKKQAAKEKCAETPLSQPEQGDNTVLNALLGAKPEESELYSMLKGIILGLRLGTGYNDELEKAAGRAPSIPWDQCQNLQKSTPSCLTAALKMQAVPENQANQSDRRAPLPEKPSHKSQATEIPVVFKSPTQSRDVRRGWSNQPVESARTIDMTDLHTQSESRALELAALSNSDRISAMEGAAPRHLYEVDDDDSVVFLK